MGPIGVPELLIILLIVIIIFGARKLPMLGQGLGEALKNFKSAIKNPEETGDEKESNQSDSSGG